MNEKIVVITGANSGIGKAAAYKFANEGYTVIMACRNMEISQPVQADMIQTTGNKSVDLIQLDLSSKSSIASFSKQFKEKYTQLDILIHNAAFLNHGIKKYQKNEHGLEISFATNVIGPYILTEQLIESLSKSNDPRILHACTTNIKNFFDPKRNIEFDNLRGEFEAERTYSTYKMYGDSKMALLMLTFKLAEQYADKGITVNALQINRVKLSKETIRKLKSGWWLLAQLQNIINPLPEKMAENYFELCTNKRYAESSGQLYNHHLEQIIPASSESGVDQFKNIFGSRTYPQYAKKQEHIEQLWTICQKEV